MAPRERREIESFHQEGEGEGEGEGQGTKHVNYVYAYSRLDTALALESALA